MSDEKRLETLSEEIKLLKGEIKNSLTSVRDYLLNMELPSSEFSTILAALSGDNSGQKVSLDGGLDGQQDGRADDIPDDVGDSADDMVQPPPDEDLIDLEQPEDLMESIPDGEPLSSEDDGTEGLINGEDTTGPEDEMLPDTGEMEGPQDLADSDELGLENEDGKMEEEEDEDEDEEDGEEEEEDEEEVEDEETEDEEAVDELEDEIEEEYPEDEIEDSGTETMLPAEEEQPMELERTAADIIQNQGTPKVNMLANLINWVAKAKKEIGEEMLPTFLDVYGVSGHLSLELKEVILNLAERTQEKTEPCTDAEVWSQAMLSLHGILTGGDAPLNPPIPAWKEALEEQDEEIIEVDKQEKPIKLKFVLPGGNGKDKEYCLDLTPGGEDEL